MPPYIISVRNNTPTQETYGLTFNNNPKIASTTTAIAGGNALFTIPTVDTGAGVFTLIAGGFAIQSDGQTRDTRRHLVDVDFTTRPGLFDAVVIQQADGTLSAPVFFASSLARL